MTFTITLDSLLKSILLIVAIIAIIVLIVLLVKVIKALKTLPSTMGHVYNIIGNVDDLSTGVKDVAHKAATALTSVKDAADANKGPIRAATGFVNAVSSLINLTRKEK